MRPLTFTYAPDGLRVARDETSKPDIHYEHFREEYRWDGGEVFAWNRNASEHFYVRGPNLAKSLDKFDPPVNGQSAAARYYYLDALGTVQTIAQAGIGHLGYNIDAWGNPGGGGSQQPYTFLGGLGYWQDHDLDLYYVRARWYDPQAARWLSVDPVSGEPRYSYVRNRPTVEVDPSGLQARRRAADRAIFAPSFPHAGTLSAYERTGPPPPPPSLEMIVRDLEKAWIEGARWVSKDRRRAATATNIIAGGAMPLSALFWRLIYTKNARAALLRLAGEQWAFLVPPALEDPKFVMYAAGFYWAAGEFLVTALPVVGWAVLGAQGLSAALQFIGAAVKNPKVWGELLRLADIWLQGMKEDLTGAVRGRFPMDAETWAYHDGKAAGRLLATMLGILLIVIGSAHVLKKVAPALSRMVADGGEWFLEANAQVFREIERRGGVRLGPPETVRVPVDPGTVPGRVEGSIVRAGGNPLTAGQKRGIQVLLAKARDGAGPKLPPNPPIRVGERVPWGVDGTLSGEAKAFRLSEIKKNPKSRFRFPGSNLLVLELKSGAIEIIPNKGRRGPHSERLLEQLLERGEIDPTHIRRIYSEREPCGPAGCNAIMRRWFPDKVHEPGFLTWSWESLNPAGKASDDDAFRALLEKL